MWYLNDLRALISTSILELLKEELTCDISEYQRHRSGSAFLELADTLYTGDFWWLPEFVFAFRSAAQNVT
jgi:hypothetical protein